jgi:hypothetical protein
MGFAGREEGIAAHAVALLAVSRIRSKSGWQVRAGPSAADSKYPLPPEARPANPPHADGSRCILGAPNRATPWP